MRQAVSSKGPRSGDGSQLKASVFLLSGATYVGQPWEDNLQNGAYEIGQVRQFGRYLLHRGLPIRHGLH